MKNIATLLLLIKGFFLRVFTIKNESEQNFNNIVEWYETSQGDHLLFVGDDVYQIPNNFTLDDFLALQEKDLGKFEKCMELKRSFFDLPVQVE